MLASLAGIRCRPSPQGSCHSGSRRSVVALQSRSGPTNDKTTSGKLKSLGFNFGSPEGWVVPFKSARDLRACRAGKAVYMGAGSEDFSVSRWGFVLEVGAIRGPGIRQCGFGWWGSPCEPAGTKRKAIRQFRGHPRGGQFRRWFQVDQDWKKAFSGYQSGRRWCNGGEATSCHVVFCRHVLPGSSS